jgi:hypothetical protein
MKQIRSLLGVVVLTIGTLSCTGRASTAIEEPFSLSLNAANATVGHGQSVQVVGTIVRGPAKGDLNLLVDGQVAGITVSVSNLSPSSSGAQASITFSTAATLAPGSYQFNIKATATGRSIAMDFTLLVT